MCASMTTISEQLYDLRLEWASEGKGLPRPTAEVRAGGESTLPPIPKRRSCPSLLQALYLVGNKKQRRQLMAVAAVVRRAQNEGDDDALRRAMQMLLECLPRIFRDKAARHGSLLRGIRAAAARYGSPL